MDGKRIYSRIKFTAETLLVYGQRRIPSELLDISLKGALVETKRDTNLEKGGICILEIHLHGSSVVIKPEAKLVFKENDHLGFQFNQIDLDSMIHLRELVATNLGSTRQVKKELFFLVGDTR